MGDDDDEDDDDDDDDDVFSIRKAFDTSNGFLFQCQGFTNLRLFSNELVFNHFCPLI